MALLHEVLKQPATFFDFGCGRGDDLNELQRAGFDAGGWDPAHRPDGQRKASDVVNLGYVVNVIEDPVEREKVLRDAWRLTKKVLIVSARLTEERDEAHVAPVRDGWVTRRGTFQKFFEHGELGEWIAQSLEASPVAASLGVYYVFRSLSDREAYLSSRFRRPVALRRRRVSDEKFATHQSLLEPLMDFVSAHGRPPHASELHNPEELVSAFGSIRRALRVVLWVTDAAAWERVQQERSVDVLVHLALARFHGRPRWSDVPDGLQRDIRAFFSSYRSACERADKLLFATGNRQAVSLVCRAASVGKVTPSAIYVHETALNDLPALLRVYEGCSRALVGTVEDANIVKLGREEPQVSYLSYPDFESDPHPALVESVHCDLQDRRVRVQNFRLRANPPILHRKELFVSPTSPLRAKFERLTAAEDRAGLYEHPEAIGTREGWYHACKAAGVELRGHRVVRLRF